MSTQLNQEQQQAALNQAYNNAYGAIFNKMWAPVFFQKLAAWGIQPQNDAEAHKLIALAHRLRAGHQNELQKKAHARTSVLDRALSDVGVVLQNEGVGLSQDDAFISEAKEVAAAAVQQDPSLRDAALLYQDFLAQALQS